MGDSQPPSLPSTSDDGQNPLLPQNKEDIQTNNNIDDDTPTLPIKDVESHPLNCVIDSPKIELIQTKNENSRNNLNDNVNCWPSLIKYNIRYCILILTVVCLTFTRSNELSFNFTVICMNSNTTTGYKVSFLWIGR